MVELAHRALDLGMALVADHDELVAFARQLGDLDVHLVHQRAGGVEDAEAALRRVGAHRLRHAVGAEDQRRAGRHVVEVLDEDRALLAQVVDDVGVVHDLVAHVDRRAEALQRALDDLDRTVDAGAKAARLGEDDFFEAHHQRIPISWTSKVTGRPASGWLKSKTSASPADLADDAGKARLAVGRREADDVADPVFGIGLAMLREQRPVHPLQQLGIALAEGLARAQLERGAAAFGQAEQARLHRRRKLAGAERERGRLVPRRCRRRRRRRGRSIGSEGSGTTRARRDSREGVLER